MWLIILSPFSFLLWNLSVQKLFLFSPSHPVFLHFLLFSFIHASILMFVFVVDYFISILFLPLKSFRNYPSFLLPTPSMPSCPPPFPLFSPFSSSSAFTVPVLEQWTLFVNMVRFYVTHFFSLRLNLTLLSPNPFVLSISVNIVSFYLIFWDIALFININF